MHRQEENVVISKSMQHHDKSITVQSAGRTYHTAESSTTPYRFGPGCYVWPILQCCNRRLFPCYSVLQQCLHVESALVLCVASELCGVYRTRYPVCRYPFVKSGKAVGRTSCPSIHVLERVALVLHLTEVGFLYHTVPVRRRGRWTGCNPCPRKGRRTSRCLPGTRHAPGAAVTPCAVTKQLWSPSGRQQ